MSTMIADSTKIPDSIPRPRSCFVRFSNETDWCYTGTVESDAELEDLRSNALIAYRQHLIDQNEAAHRTLRDWSDWSPRGQHRRAQVSSQFCLSRDRLRCEVSLSLHVWSWGQWVATSAFEHHLRGIQSPFRRCVKQVRWGKCLAGFVGSIVNDITEEKIND